MVVESRSILNLQPFSGPRAEGLVPSKDAAFAELTSHAAALGRVLLLRGESCEDASPCLHPSCFATEVGF